MGDLTDFEKGTIVGARRAGMSIARTVELLGFSKAAVSKVYARWSRTRDVSSRRPACGRRPLMDESGRSWLARAVRENGRSSVREVTSQYNRGSPRPVSERTVRRALRQLGCRVRQDLKEKKEVVEEKEKKENGSGDAPANGTEENGAEHTKKNAEHTKKKAEDPEEEEEDEVEGEGEGEGEEEEEEEGEGEETEADGHSVKRPADDEEKSETKKQKTENGDSTEVKESA